MSAASRPRARRLAVVLAALASLGVLLLPGPLATASAGSAGVVDVQVVPPMPGVRLSIGGVVATTDGSGWTRVALGDIDNVARRVHLASHAVGPRTTVRILRVAPQPHVAPHVSTLQVGMEVRSRVRVQVDPGSTRVGARDVVGLRLHSLAGQVVTINPRRHRGVTLVARRTMLQHGVLRAQSVTWTVDRVTTVGGATVTTDRRPFDPRLRPTWSVRLVPVAGTVRVRTVPATRGVQFSLGGQSLTTDAHGRVTSRLADLDAVSGAVRLASPWAGADRVRLLHTAHLPPPRPGTRRLLLALSVSRPVHLDFRDSRGDPVPRGRVSRVRLDQAGRTITLRHPDRPGPVWLTATVAANVRGHWTPRRVAYSVRSVLVDGSNAVFDGRQHFAAADSRWRVRLSVFPLAVTVSDALFGHPTGSALELRLPDGRVRGYRIGAGEPTVIPGLVRGLYRVDVGAAVVGSRSSLLVSRTGAADLRVITALDVAVVLAGLALVAGGLVALGRVFVRRTDPAARGGAG